MRARRLSRLAGLVLALAALAIPVRAASGSDGYSTLDFEWSAPAAYGAVNTTSSGAGSTVLP
jgi:hypothetical protein